MSDGDDLTLGKHKDNATNDQKANAKPAVSVQEGASSEEGLEELRMATAMFLQLQQEQMTRSSPTPPGTPLLLEPHSPRTTYDSRFAF